MNNSVKVLLAALVMALGLVASAALLSKLFLRIRHEQTIAVKGYAERAVTSDVGKLVCTFRARGQHLQESYAALQTNRAVVETYLHDQGFQPEEIALETIATQKIAKRDAQGREMNEIEFYDLAQSITVQSTNVSLLSGVATGLAELIKEGIDLTVSAPSFYVTDLEAIKLELLARATADGYQRAVMLAEGSHGKVGPLVSAQQGVFQITSRHSTETAGYGVYDTATIEKTVKAVVTLEYEIQSPKQLN